jgi:hypothetical protein
VNEEPERPVFRIGGSVIKPGIKEGGGDGVDEPRRPIRFEPRAGEGSGTVSTERGSPVESGDLESGWSAVDVVGSKSGSGMEVSGDGESPVSAEDEDAILPVVEGGGKGKDD